MTDGSPLRAPQLPDIRHVVILMQENRSFDHYFGTLCGVRGFDDQQTFTLPGGRGVFEQPDARHDDGRVLLPFRLDSSTSYAQAPTFPPHDWETTHAAAGRGAWNGWTGAKGAACMGYFTRADIPYHYALADAFTICDHYFCSVAACTDPNRLYLWSGTAGPGVDGSTGPFTDNSVITSNPVADWTSYAERLEAAGVSWRVYHTPGDDPIEGDFECNGLSYFKQFHAFPEDDPRYVNAMTKFDLAAFAEHCADGTLPTVSWLVAPQQYSEHPEAPEAPAHGALYVDTALQALFANPEVWQHTVFLLMYDENDGFFDHVVPPMPPAGTPDEFVGEEAIGLGPRVPMLAISPWSRGGYVDSQVFDHTSVLRFLELVTGVSEPNISAWRRALCGDLTSCFDFDRPDYSIPALPDARALLDRAIAGRELPPVIVPEGPQRLPAQEPGTRPRRALPYRPGAELTVDQVTGRVTCTLTNHGTTAYHFNLARHLPPFTTTGVTLAPGRTHTYTWDGAGTDGRYDFSVHGADGFLRRWAGRR